MTTAEIGPLLRHWRTSRRHSQLDLALEAEISSRHLSFVETGRAAPSREMVLKLADTLRVPLRERNRLLVAAGFAPRYGESELGAPQLAEVRSAIDLILAHQEPYPAFVVDRYWEILLGNQAGSRCSRFLLGSDPTESNMQRLLLGTHGLRRVMVNWEETAADLIRHLHTQVAAAPGDVRLAALLAEVLAYPGIPPQGRTRDISAPSTPLLTVHFRKGEVDLRFFSTFTMFGTPNDVALEDLRIDCSFPADADTAERCKMMFG